MLKSKSEAIEVLSRPFFMDGVPDEVLSAHRMAIDALKEPQIKTNTIFSGVSIDPRYSKENLWYHRITGTGIKVSGEEMYLYRSRDWVEVDPESIEVIHGQNDDSGVR